MITDISPKEMKLRTRSNLGLEPDKILFATEHRNLSDNVVRLDEYRQYWESLEDVRDRMRENIDFMRGRQLERKVVNDSGEAMTEAEYIAEQGKTPYVQNIIRPIVTTIEGLFRQDKGKSMVVSRKPGSAKQEKMLTNALQSVLDVNEISEVDPRVLDYFLASGIPAQRLGFDYWPDLQRHEVLIDYYDPNYIFFNNDIQDIRGKDLRLIGMLHDMTLDDMYVHFARSGSDKEAIRRLYHVDRHETPHYDSLSPERIKNLNFYVPTETHKCRVIEVWEKRAVDVIKWTDEADGSEGEWTRPVDELEAIAVQRFEKYRAEGFNMEDVPRILYKFEPSYRWFYKFMTPWGHVLKEGVSPYRNFQHPFVLAPYPLISGEVFGFVEELKDTQEQYNRIFTLMDFILNTSAKNTLILDEASLNGKRPEDIAEDYRRVGGVIVLKLKDGAKPPKELKGAGLDRALFEIINMYTKLMQDISGVQPSLQGQAAGSNVPASRYIAEAQGSTINLKRWLDFFASYRKKRDMKVLDMILQFYNSGRYLTVSGSDSKEDKYYDPEEARKLANDLQLVIAKGGDSPVYRAMNDEMLKDLLLKKLITLEQFLKHTDYPYSKALLEDLQNAKEQAESGEDPNAVLSGLGQAVQRREVAA